MARAEKQKVKTLFVAKYFLENSDENHPITAGDIVDYLREDCGIEAERPPSTGILPPCAMCTAWT